MNYGCIYCADGYDQEGDIETMTAHRRNERREEDLGMGPQMTADEMFDAVLHIVREQPYFPDTNVGTRQQWVKDQIIIKVETLRREACPDLTTPVEELIFDLTWPPRLKNMIRYRSGFTPVDDTRRFIKPLKTLGDLLNLTDSDLLRIRNFGRASLHELDKLLALKGLMRNPNARRDMP